MPGHRLAPEACGEALEEGLGQRDLGQQDEALAAGGDRGGDRLEIDFGLARSGDAVEQPGLEITRVDRRDQRLRGGEIGRASCRGSVCHYVSLTVVAVALKKKTNNTLEDSNTYK